MEGTSVFDEHKELRRIEQAERTAEQSPPPGKERTINKEEREFLSKFWAEAEAASVREASVKVKHGNIKIEIKGVTAFKSASGKATIVKPPGATVLAILGVFVAKRALERVFDQTVGDMREECNQAIVSKRPWSYRVAWFRGHLAIAFAVFTFLTASVLKRIVDIWKIV